MTKSEKHVRSWKSGAKFDVPWEDARLVLEAHDFTFRPDGENHWLAYHENLRTHPQFPLGRFKVNCHYRKQGVVHPSAINDILKAIKHLGEMKND